MRVDVKTNTVLYNFSTKFGNSVSKVCIYPEKIKFTHNKLGIKDNEKLDDTVKENTKLNLVVVNTIHPALIFQ